MRLDGSLAHHQRFGDLAVRFALGDQRSHLALARRQSAEFFFRGAQ
jgi:hypothetical protein